MQGGRCDASHRLSRERVLQRAIDKRTRPLPGGDGVGLEPELRQAIDTFVSANKIVVFMKGNRQMPQCGFSNRVVQVGGPEQRSDRVVRESAGPWPQLLPPSSRPQILNSMGVPYETVDVLADDRIRTGMKEYSMWPTFPQVYIDGEFYGGCDIVTEKFTSGELAEDLERALSS